MPAWSCRSRCRALRAATHRLFEGLKSSTKLFTYETTIPVLDPGRGRTKDRPTPGLCAR
jgi:hypothetical protein